MRSFKKAEKNDMQGMTVRSLFEGLSVFEILSFRLKHFSFTVPLLQLKLI